MTEYDKIYKGLLGQIKDRGIEELNKRTGHKTKSLPGLTFSIDVGNQGFPLLTLRKIPIKLFVAEQVWFLMGGRRPDDFLNQFTKIWDDFTNPGGTITAAYGHRWRRHFGRDQIGDLLKLLEKDPTSRHGVIVTWDPGSDGLGGIKRGNVPCPYTFTVNIIGGKLHLHSMVRSNDMILGFPHDVAGFALLQTLLAERLKVGVGVYTHTISNAHVYDIHYEAMDKLLGRRNSHPTINLKVPSGAFRRAERGEVGIVKKMVNILQDQYEPMGAISGLAIVL